MFSLLNRFLPTGCRNLFLNNACGIHTTPQLWAEPMKRKRRIDPQILKQREQRRIRKLEKGIRLLKKHAKKMKPIEEMEVSPRLQKELTLRARKPEDLSVNTVNFRQDLMRVWGRVQFSYYQQESKIINDMVDCQKAALDALKELDRNLYDAAMQPDVNLIPYKIGAVTRTPPLKDFQPLDGKYTETTKKWRP